MRVSCSYRFIDAERDGDCAHNNGAEREKSETYLIADIRFSESANPLAQTPPKVELTRVMSSLSKG